MGWTDKALALVKGATHPAEALSQMRARFDSWANAITGLATTRDKSTFTLPYPSPLLSPIILEAMYHDDDIAARIVSAVPDECFREGFTVVSKSAANQINEFLAKNPKADKETTIGVARKAMQGEPNTVQERATELQTDLDTFGTREKLREAMTWGRLYGLGAILIGIDDGGETWEALAWENVRGFTFMTVFDKRDLTPWRWYADIQAPHFGDIAIYLLQPVGVFVGAPYDLEHVNANQVLLVHESRLIRFGGELTGKRLRLANQGADYSILQKCFRALQLTNDNWQSAAALLSDASQGVLTIKGLIDMIAQQPDVMQSRFQFMDMARSVVRAIVLDADGEKFERVPSRLEGIGSLLNQTWDRLCAAARIPRSILMGNRKGGLSDNDDSGQRWWYDTIKATQESGVKPQLERLLKLIAVSKWGAEGAEDWSVVFLPLWQMTELERAQLHFQQAQADNLDIQNGMATPTEKALSRWGSGKYSLDTQIDVETRKRIMAMELERMETEAANEVEVAVDPPPTPGVAAEAEKKAREADPEMPPPVVET